MTKVNTDKEGKSYQRLTMCEADKSWINLGYSFSTKPVEKREEKMILTERMNMHEGFQHPLAQDEIMIGLSCPLVAYNTNGEMVHCILPILLRR